MKLDFCKVSIIIPVYHVDLFLFERCLSSIKDQNWRNLEVIIVFDESIEKYKAILENYQERDLQIIVEEQEHCGVASARNRGIERAMGKWIMFVDADDWLESNAIEMLISAGEEKNADIVMGSHAMEYGNAVKMHEYKKGMTVFEKASKEVFEKDVLKPQTGAGFVWGKAFLKKFLVEKRIYFNNALSAAEDAEFMFRAACAANRIMYIGNICYHYWFNADSAVRKYRKDYADKYILSMEAIQQDIEQHREKKYCQEAYFSCVLYHLLLIVINFSFHPDSEVPRKNQIKEFKKLLRKPIFAEALKHVHYGDFSKTRQVTLWCIKNDLYFMVKLIAMVRHMQFKKYSKR